MLSPPTIKILEPVSGSSSDYSSGSESKREVDSAIRPGINILKLDDNKKRLSKRVSDTPTIE
jgi:hypothetical protein